MRLVAAWSAAAFALPPAIAAAHVTVWPRQSEAGARERYVVRVPNEKPVPTVRLDGRFPPEARVVSLQQVPGWAIAPRRDATGAIVGATWTGSLPPDQFVEFGLMAVNPKTARTLTWDFVQTYADGTTVAWTGAPGSRTPAPQVELLTAAHP